MMLASSVAITLITKNSVKSACQSFSAPLTLQFLTTITWMIYRTPYPSPTESPPIWCQFEKHTRRNLSETILRIEFCWQKYNYSVALTQKENLHL